MIRRDFLKSAVQVAAGAGALGSQRMIVASAAPDRPCAGILPRMTDVTKYVSDFAVNAKYSDVPSDVVELGKKSILDSLGLALAGSRSETAKLILAYVRSLGCSPGKVSVLGTSAKWPLRFAAFANGVAIHVDDFDDTQLAVQKDRVYGLLTHPSVAVLPAVMGSAELKTTSGQEFIIAYQVGVEVECKITEAISPRSYQDGFHSTGICGVFGSTAGVARLRGYSSDLTTRAFGVAASKSAGLRENFGTMMKPFQAGHAAESGVVAADFAELGWTAATTILEADSGFFHAYGGSYAPDSLLQKLGGPWTFAAPGVSIKPFPSGSLTHPGMTELLRMIRANNIHADDVVQVEVGANHSNLTTLIRHQPKNGLEAKFSMEYSMAVLLVNGKAGLGEYTDAAVNQSAVQNMIKRVRFYEDPEAEAAGYDKMSTIIKIHLKNGNTLRGHADFGKGSPGNPMSYDQVAEKFYGCAEYAKWPTGKSKQIVEFVRNLERATDMRELISLCSV
jgi:2-methylcitrate dehydratase PrpD